jgi:hypothetical protein
MLKIAKLLASTDVTTLKFITGIFFLSLAHKKKRNLVFSEFFGIFGIIILVEFFFFGGFRIIFFVGVIESISTDGLNKLAFYSTGGKSRGDGQKGQ